MTFILMVQTVRPEEREKIKTSQAGNKGFTLNKHPCAGFTLLELIVVLFIVGVSLSIVVVAAGRIFEKTVFKETSKKVFITLKYARETAILGKTPVTFKVGEKGSSFWLEKDWVVEGRVQNLPERVSISGESIIFFPKGNSSGGLIKIKDEKERGCSIEVDPVLGKPTVKGF